MQNNKKKGGKARWKNVTKEERSEIMKKIAASRQKKYVLVLRTEYDRLVEISDRCTCN